MKKQLTAFSTIIFLALGCLSFANSAYADTEVSGNITTNNVWTLASSPYIVTDTVKILEGAKLTIEAGVIVKFNIETSLINDGELIVIGSENQKIVFTSNQPTPKPGDWGMINFFTNAVASTIDGNNSYLSGSVIKYSRIEFGGGQGNGNNAGVVNNFSNKSYLISNSTITNNNSSGIDMRNSIITNNIITDNRQYGIRGGTLVKGNFLENNSTGLYTEGGKIINNIIRNNRNIGIEIASSNPSITYNNITNNTSYNIRLKYNVVPNGIDVPYNYFGSVDKSAIDDSIYDYFDNALEMGKVNYEPYALAELKFDGTDIFSQPSACTSWTYSNWTSCSNNGQQTRTVISSSPNSCSGGNPVLTQSCTYTPPTCTSWSYSNWSTCSNSGQQTRSTISSSPTGCAGGSPVLTGSCTYATPTCTSWVYSAWNTCANSQQTRNIESSQPSNCAGGNPVLSQSCNSTPSCTESNWTSTLAPTNCPSNGQQLKKWTKIGQCQNGISHSSEESVSCNYQAPTCTTFTYSDWGTCNASGVQSRSTLSSSPSACVGGNPVLSQSCKYISVEVPNKISVVETKNNPPVSTNNQNSQNVSTLTKNNEQEVNQGETITNSQVAEQRKSDVASAVQKIIQITGKDSKVGEQVKTITETQAQSQEKLETSLQKVQSRSGFAKFFVGPNYSEINNAKKLLEQNREQIKQLDEVQNQLTNKSDKQKLTEQVQLLEQTNQEIENSLSTSQKGFSLFGWIFRLFTE